MKDGFTPKNKMSKKAKKMVDAQMRVLWGSINPVTRVAPGKKDLKYKRSKMTDDYVDEDN